MLSNQKIVGADMVMHFAVKPPRPEQILPRILRVHKWADVVWHRVHPTGAVLVVFRLTPLQHYVASWLPCPSFKSHPAHIAAVSLDDVSPAQLDDQIHEFGMKAFAVEPDRELWHRALEISAKYSKNGQRKRGKTKKGKGAETGAPVSTWRQQIPDHHFSTYQDQVILKSRKNWGYVSLLTEDCQGKDLDDWNRTGPTSEMVKRLAEPNGIWDL